MFSLVFKPASGTGSWPIILTETSLWRVKYSATGLDVHDTAKRRSEATGYGLLTLKKRREIELWEAVNERSRFTLMVSLSTTDESVRKRFEPHASPVQDRLETLRAFKRRGCAVGVVAMPFLPFISDSKLNIRELYEEVSEVGVDFIPPAGLTLRPGKQKDLYLGVMDKHFSELSGLYRQLYGENRPSGSPRQRYYHELMNTIHEIQGDASIPPRMPHHIYTKQFPLYDEILILLDHMAHLYHQSDAPTDRLDRSLWRYKQWLEEEMRLVKRSRGKQRAVFEEKTLAMICSCQFADLVANERLGRFLAEMVRENKVFNYRTRELEPWNDGTVQ